MLGHFTCETAATPTAGGVNAGGASYCWADAPAVNKQEYCWKNQSWGVLLVGQQSPLLLEKSVSQPMQGGLLLLLEEGDNAGAAGVFYCWRSQVLGRFNIETAATIIAGGEITNQYTVMYTTRNKKRLK